MTKVCWISAGVSSFVAGYLAKADLFIYIDVKDQHPDSIRFIKDCEKALNKEILILRNSDYDDVNDVLLSAGFIRSPHGAPCTYKLKKYVRKLWERNFILEHGVSEFMNLVYVWGYDRDETQRRDRILSSFPETKHEFPLIDRNMDKSSVHGFFESNFNFKRPLMYDLGYCNNNCIGCIKGGAGYWNKIRKDFPDVFVSRANLERENDSLIHPLQQNEK